MTHFLNFPAFLFPFILALLCLAPPSIGHIILTFPEARYPPFDFLDSPRTLGPCGVPKSARSAQTNLQAGKMYKLSWRMATEWENETIRLSLLNERGDLVPNGVRGKNDADPMISDQSLSAEFVFPSECRNCTLLLEKYENADGNLERSCAEIDVKAEELSLTQKCSDNGKWQSGSHRAENGQCQCAHGFSGEYCQNRDDCAADSDCGLGGKCIQDGVIQGQKSCFCQFGFFGTNCERRSDPDPADQRCFRHNGPSPNAAEGQFLYGLFNPECYQQRELEGGDRLYWRLLGNHLELLLDFGTNSWAALGWRPLQIPPTCRLFPQIESPEVELAKTSGFARNWLESPLHPMDCVDLVMGSVREGSWLHIADMYSRDRSSPLKDAWLDGEESLSAAYGLQSQNRTILMFRRLVPEIEPTDHPLGPGPLFVIYAKGPEKTKANGRDGQWKYHGNETQNRGHLQLEFVAPSQMSRVRGPLIHLDSASAESTKEEKTTTTETKTSKTTKTTAKLATNSIQTSTAASLNAAGNNKGKLSKESKGIGSIWMRTKEREETEKSSTAAISTTENGLEGERTTESATKQQKEENVENGGEENAVELNEQRRIEFGGNRQKEPMEGNGHDGRMDGRERGEENAENGGPSNHVGPRESGEELEEEEGGDGRHSSFFSSSSGKMMPSLCMARLFPFCWLIPSSWLILRLYG